MTAAIDWQHELREHDRWLRTVVAARVRDAHAVDEVMQEVALAVARRRAPPDDPTRVGPWLYRVAVRAALAHLRRGKRRRGLAIRYAERLPGRAQPAVDNDPLDWLLRAERHALVRQALRELPPRDAEILLLKYTEGWKYREIASRLGVSQATVESRLFRARQRLRERLAARNIEYVG